jgi:hypothetical protein
LGWAVHVIDYIEGVSQQLAYYVNELRSKGYDKARCILPQAIERTSAARANLAGAARRGWTG